MDEWKKKKVNRNRKQFSQFLFEFFIDLHFFTFFVSGLNSGGNNEFASNVLFDKGHARSSTLFFWMGERMDGRLKNMGQLQEAVCRPVG